VWIFFVLLILGQWRPHWRSGLRAWTVAAGGVALVVVASALWATRSVPNTRLAVVTQRDAVARLGPFEESQSAVDLKNGAELKILDQKEDWIQVTPDNQLRGWIMTNSVRILSPN
jgi:hypothetical protein